MDRSGIAQVFVLNYEGNFDVSKFDLIFSEERKRKLERCKAIEMRLQLAAAELTVCAAMRAIGKEYTPPRYTYDGLGKPSFAGGYMSISHTRGLAACALADVPIGIDVERSRKIRSGLVDRVLCEEERLRLGFGFGKKCENDEDLVERFLRYWTAKESFIKMTGEGLSAGMKNIFYDEAMQCVYGMVCSDENMNGISAEASPKRLKLCCPVAVFEKAVPMRGEDCENSSCRTFVAVCCRSRTEINLFRFDSPEDLLMNKPFAYEKVIMTVPQRVGIRFDSWWHV